MKGRKKAPQAKLKAPLERVEMGMWEAFRRSDLPQQSIQGKYLFFAGEPAMLREIAITELTNHDFPQAKLPLEGRQVGQYVLCLYANDDSRVEELRGRYATKSGVTFRGWKSNEATARGEYSSRFIAQRDLITRDVGALRRK